MDDELEFIVRKSNENWKDGRNLEIVVKRHLGNGSSCGNVERVSKSELCDISAKIIAFLFSDEKVDDDDMLDVP